MRVLRLALVPLLMVAGACWTPDDRTLDRGEEEAPREFFDFDPEVSNAPMPPPLLSHFSEVSFEAADGVEIHADYHQLDNGRSNPVALLFHQGGASARGEYSTIIANVMRTGWSVLAVDLRKGGGTFGAVNRTAAAVDQDAMTYCDAALDITAALDLAPSLPGATGRAILWGSSYSAALVLREAARRPDDVAAVLAFSPASGDAMDGCRPDGAAPQIRVPALVLRPASEAAIPEVAAQLQAFQEAGLETHVADPGAHGSSMLVPSRVGDRPDHTLFLVQDFLRRVLGG